MRFLPLSASVLGPLTAVLLAGFPALAGTSLPVTVDGDFGEWSGLEPLASDRMDDGRPGGVDLGRLWAANDEQALYLRFEVGSETLLQNPIGEPLGNRLRLYLDLDSSAATGLPVEGLGAELEIRFGERRTISYDRGGLGHERVLGGTGIVHLPTHSAPAFELRVPFAAGGSPELAARLAAGAGLTLVLAEAADGGDRLPGSGVHVYETSAQPVPPPRPIGLRKKKPRRRVRLLCFNVERTTIRDRPETYRRLLTALRPDLIAFQEIFGWSAEETRRFVEEALPLGEGRRWAAFQAADTVTVSSFPILAAAAVDDNLVVQIDLPERLTPHDLVLFNAHTPCCGNNAGRDAEHDRIMATWRDLLEGTGPFPIGDRDAVILAGDFNMVGFRRQLDVLLHGRFIDSANGPDFAPGRGKGSLRSARLRHSHARAVHTWRRATSEFGPGKLDFVIYSSDVAKLKRNFTLDTGSLPEQVLEEFGLLAADSLEASDHLALVADFRFKRR